MERAFQERAICGVAAGFTLAVRTQQGAALPRDQALAVSFCKPD